MLTHSNDKLYIIILLCVPEPMESLIHSDTENVAIGNTLQRGSWGSPSNPLKSAIVYSSFLKPDHEL